MNSKNTILFSICTAAIGLFVGSSAVAQIVCPSTLVASDPAEGDEFGRSVALDGGVAVVGAWRDDDNGGSSGSAYILRFDGTAWVQEQKLLAADGEAQSYFGNSVAIEGLVAVVGAPLEDENGVDSGSVYVFRYDGASWVQEQELHAPGSSFHEWLGYAVAIADDVIAIGAPAQYYATSQPGSVHVFRFNGSSWVHEQQLLAGDGAGGDALGFSVDIDGARIVAGAFADDDLGNVSGSAYVFRYDGSSWVQEQKLLPDDGAVADQFGRSVAISGDSVVVGSYADDDNGSDAGSAYVFRYDGTNWIQEQKLLASDGMSGHNFGASAALVADVVVIGAPHSYAGPGSAYVFRFDGSTWSEARKLGPFEGVGPSGFFGFSVAYSQDNVLIGAYRGNDACPEVTQCYSGSAQVFMGLSGNDCNGNGFPDECEPDEDCNGNGRQDICDIAAGHSEDCNDNSIPDECIADELDCNGTLIPDACDLADNTSSDCNGNGIPDECDLDAGSSQDCNGNGIPDECGNDCNGNGLDDSCDIADGTSEDCDGSGVPDECENECNGNGLEDSCDIANGTSEDCTGNGIPDECEPDCNSNGAADSCDIASGTSDDCQGNGIPDECEVSGGTSQDCNTNAIPDECEQDCNNNDLPDQCDITAGTSDDCTNNGIPDECEPDCNQNGIVDTCEIAAGMSPDCDGNGVPDECEWAQQEKLIGSDPLQFDLFGSAVSISGDRAVVGALMDGNTGSPYFAAGVGAAYVCRRDDNGTPFDPSDDSWIQEVKLTAFDGVGNDQLGISVAISGDVVVVGANNADGLDADGNEIFNPGAAYVYRWNGSTWVEEAKLTASDAEHFDQFGKSVSISGDTIAVGNRLDDDAGVVTGSAYVFRWDGSTWVEEAKFIPSVGISYFGRSIAISGDTLVVGGTGGTHVFRWNGSDWEEAILTISATSVAVSEDTVVVGFGPEENDTGLAYVYQWNGKNWVQEAVLTASDASDGDFFGGSVAIRGDTIVAGAAQNSDGGEHSGSAYVFRRTGEGWAEEAKLVAPIASAENRFGSAVAIDNGVEPAFEPVMLVGASADFDPHHSAGSAYLFEHLDANGDGVPDACEELCAANEECDDGFECTVDTCDVSAPEAGADGCVHSPTANGTVCDDGEQCTMNDECIAGVCVGTYQQRLFGDIVPGFCPPTCPQPDLDDILCIIDGFGAGPGWPAVCPVGDLDPCPPGNDDDIDLDDILKVIDAFGGNASCPDPCP